VHRELKEVQEGRKEVDRRWEESIEKGSASTKKAGPGVRGGAKKTLFGRKKIVASRKGGYGESDGRGEGGGFRTEKLRSRDKQTKSC